MCLALMTEEGKKSNLHSTFLYTVKPLSGLIQFGTFKDIVFLLNDRIQVKNKTETT